MINPFYELLSQSIYGFAGGDDPRIAANDATSGRGNPLALITTVGRTVAQVGRAVAHGIHTWLVIPMALSLKRNALFEELNAMSDRQLAKSGIARTDIARLAFNAYAVNDDAVVAIRAASPAVAKPAANDHPAKDGSIAA